MPGIDLAGAGAILIMAAAQAPVCPMPKATQITVSPVTKDVKKDTSQTLAQIQGVHMDTINPHSFGGTSMTQGFMKGAIAMTPQVKLNYSQIDGYDAMCLWYESINVKIEIDPTIVIAREVAADKCMGPAVLEHEMKHVKADRQIVNKYAKIMGQKVMEALKERGFKSEIIPIDHGKATAERMQQTVFEVVQHEYKKMELDRMDVQRAIDSKEEYERVSALCPVFGEKIFSHQSEKKR